MNWIQLPSGKFVNLSHISIVTETSVVWSNHSQIRLSADDLRALRDWLDTISNHSQIRFSADDLRALRDWRDTISTDTVAFPSRAMQEAA